MANPIVVIGNEADPITPFISAKKVGDSLGKSAILVKQADDGHTSLVMHSKCTTKILYNCFTNGSLPKTNEFCETNQDLFPDSELTRNTLSVVRSGSSNSDTDNQSELGDAKPRSKGLLHVVLILAAAVGLFFFLFVGICWMRRRSKRLTNIHKFHFPGEGDEDETYEDMRTYNGIEGRTTSRYPLAQT